MAISRQKSNRLCVFQMHHSDMSEHLTNYNAVVKVRDSGLFDRIVLAVPDLPENRPLIEWANKWEIGIHFGSARNVARRIYECCESENCEIVMRALVWWFFIDLQLVERMLHELEETKVDWVNLPRNCDVRFGGDAFTKRFLEKALSAFEDKLLEERFQFNPWGYAELNPEQFDIRTLTDLPVYGERYFHELRERMLAVWPERWDGSGSPIYPYQMAARYVQPGHKVLDVACGLGAGTYFLGQHGSAVGVDADADTITACRKKYGGHSSVEFYQTDIYQADFSDNEFDQIVSVHTMEHLPDDREFLYRVSRWLKPGGIFVLEVPLLKEFPFKGIETPLSPCHLREYKVPELIDLVSEFFSISESHGVTRGYYTKLSDARDGALLVSRGKDA